MANEISKSLIIGIGGTGQNIVIALKKRLYQRFGAIPDLIKLISIDADIINEKDDNFSFEYQGKIIEKEIRIEEPEQYYFGRVNMKDQLEDGIYKGFVPKNIKSIASKLSSGKGAEGKRIIGKMLLASNYEEVDNFIIGKIEDIISKTSTEYEIEDNETIRVFIAGSFAGGAGSSMFMDISSMLKSSKYKDNIDLVGFFAMPEFYTQYPNQDNALANAYGCFLELDHIQESDTPQTKQIPDAKGKIISERRFDSIYIIQNILSNTTKIKRDTMEDAIAASISNLVSVMGAKGDEIGVNNLQFDDYIMKGKRRGYSSFGICEIVLQREEFKKFIVNKLIRNALNEYRTNNFNKDEFDIRRDQFIDDNNLDEGIGNEAKTVNKLIDSVYKLDCADLDIFFPEITVSPDVIEELKDSYKIFRQSLNNKTNGLLLQFDNNILNDSINEKGIDQKGIMTKLSNLLKELLYSNGGLSRARLFSESFVSHLFKMRKELKTEISEHEDAISQIEDIQLSNIYKEIKEKQKGWFTKSHIKDLLENYSYIISSTHDENSFRTHYLEIIRKQKAIAVYKKLISIVSEYYKEEGNTSSGKVSIFEKSINEAINSLGLTIRQFITANNKPFNKINIEVNYFLIKVLENKSISQEIMVNNPINVADFLLKNPNTNNLIHDLERILMQNVNNSETILSKLNDDKFTIDDLINKYKDTIIQIGKETGYKKTSFKNALISEINNNLPIMWKYQRMNVPHEGGKVKLPELVAIIGSSDGQKNGNGFLSYDVISKFKGLPSKISQNSYSNVATNNPNVLSIYIQEHAVPAFALANMENYKEDYVDLGRGSTSYYHTDIRFEKHVSDIFPKKNDEKFLQLWVVGFFTNLISNKRSGYYVKSKSGAKGTDVKCFDDSNPKGKNDRVLAFEYFSESENFPNEIKEKYENMLDRDKQKLRKQLIEYLHNTINSRTNLGKFEKSLSDSERELLFKEAKMLIKIGLDDLGMHSRDFIKDSLSDEELEDYKQYLFDLGAEEVF
jgi:hypothetical protein